MLRCDTSAQNEHEMEENIYCCISFLLEATVTVQWPPPNQTAAARLSLSTVYPGGCQFPDYATQRLIDAISQ